VVEAKLWQINAAECLVIRFGTHISSSNAMSSRNWRRAKFLNHERLVTSFEAIRHEPVAYLVASQLVGLDRTHGKRPCNLAE